MRVNLVSCCLLDGPHAGERHAIAHQPGSRPRCFLWQGPENGEGLGEDFDGPHLYRLVRVADENGHELHYSYRGDGFAENLVEMGLAKEVEVDPADAWKGEAEPAASDGESVAYQLTRGPGDGLTINCNRRPGQMIAEDFLTLALANGRVMLYLRMKSETPNRMVHRGPRPLDASRLTFAFVCAKEVPSGFDLPGN
jgi:hypothetical protein